MNYWWVNHKQTHIAEIEGGYIWSPKTEKNGARSQFYINLTLVQSGDVIFSYADTKIRAIGVVQQSYKEQAKPSEFGHTGKNWANLGWIVPVEWRVLQIPFSPKAYIKDIEPLLPNGYSPINPQGNGNQKCYLAQISKSLADYLFSLLSIQNPSVLTEIGDIEVELETRFKVEQILNSPIEFTEKEQLIKARFGQGVYRKRLLQIETMCRLTGVADLQFLTASHIKPWRDSSDYERLDGHNGVLLSPHVDRLFDRGWISFEDDGSLLVSNDATNHVMMLWGLTTASRGKHFSDQQKIYLKYHRNYIYKG